MGKPKIKPNYRRRSLRLPDLDHCKRAVLNSLGSPASRRVYEYAIDQFIAWYCSEPRLAFNRIVVVRYRMFLESRGLAANTINQQLAAVRRLAHEAADSGLLMPELAAGISRVKGVKQLGFRSGNWLSAKQSSEVLKYACGNSMRAKRDYAMLALLFGCGFRRSELVGLELDEIQMRQGHWAVVVLIGKGGHIRTVPIPEWVKLALDQWTRAAGVTEGRIFRAVARAGKVWGKGISQNVVWYVVKTCCERTGLEHIAPHDLRRTCASDGGNFPCQGETGHAGPHPFLHQSSIKILQGPGTFDGRDGRPLQQVFQIVIPHERVFLDHLSRVDPPMNGLMRLPTSPLLRPVPERKCSERLLLCDRDEYRSVSTTMTPAARAAAKDLYKAFVMLIRRTTLIRSALLAQPGHYTLIEKLPGKSTRGRELECLT